MDTFFQWVDRAEQATAVVRYDIWRRSVDRPTTIHYMSVLVVSSNYLVLLSSVRSWAGL